MRLTKNEHLYEVEGKMKSCDPSTLTQLAQANRDALTVFGSRIGGVLDGTSDDGWHDKVRTGVTTAMEKIKGFIEEEKTSCDFITGAVGPINNLKTILSEYVEAFDAYAAIADSPPERYVQEDGKDKINDNGTKTQRTEYTEWQKKVYAYEQSIPTLESEAERLEEAVKNYFAAINLTTHTIDGSVYHEGDGDIKIKFQEMFRKLSEIPDDEWTKVGDTDVEYDPATGTITTKEKFEVQKEFEDGSKVEAKKDVERKYDDINGDGKVDDDDALIYEKVHTEGTYTDPTGKVYGFTEDKESDVIGLVKLHQEVTDQENGDTVFKRDDERQAAYESNTCGTTVEMNSKVEDEETVTETRTVKMENYQEQTEIKTSKEDPEVGTVEHEDGSKTVVYRDENGQLCSREESKDKDGKPVVSENGPVDTSSKKKVTITYSDGRPSEEMIINPDNPIDRQRVSNKMEDARSEFYEAGSGLGPRWCDLESSGETGVSGCMSDDSITFTMTDAE
jgi:hypothetical protein